MKLTNSFKITNKKVILKERSKLIMKIIRYVQRCTLNTVLNKIRLQPREAFIFIGNIPLFLMNIEKYYFIKKHFTVF